MLTDRHTQTDQSLYSAPLTGRSNYSYISEQFLNMGRYVLVRAASPSTLLAVESRTSEFVHIIQIITRWSDLRKLETQPL